MKKQHYTARQRVMLKQHINTLLKASTAPFLTPAEQEYCSMTYCTIEAECRAYSKATGSLLTVSEFVAMFI
ncbi:MAG: hypothetical protein IKU44_04440 [Firmicutes bacterium]|nr:hypothetical protein [Bacillota bacterium]